MISSNMRSELFSYSILIVGGAGTFGSSTALHLSRRGYTNIHILDPYALPSQQSAGNDLNKVSLVIHQHLILPTYM